MTRFASPLLLILLLVSVSQSVYAQGAPRSLTAGVSSSGLVTLRWLAPTTPGFSGYLIEAGASAGTTAVSLPVGNTLFYNVNAPNGRYYVRVRALYGGTPGAASNEVEVFVGVLPPAAPANFAVTVTRFTVTFTWTQGLGSSTVTGWQLHAGSASGLADIATVSFPSATRSMTVTAPAGTYYVRVYALNQGGASPPSTELTVVTGAGVCDVPLTPAGLLATAGMGGVRLRWNTWSGPLPAGYLVAAGSAPGASDLGTFPIARATNFTTAAPAATYYVRLAAYNDCGASPFGDEVSFTVLPPMPSPIGTWTGTVSNYTKPYPWTPITNFQLTINSHPGPPFGQFSGLWIDNKGCISDRMLGEFGVLPYFSLESLACNDGDFVFTITSATATVMEGRCNSGPNCTFRMTR